MTEDVKQRITGKIEDLQKLLLQITLKRNASSATAERLFHF